MRERRLRQIFSPAFQGRSRLEYQAAWERGGGARAGKPKCVRILTMTAGASIAALMPRPTLAVIDDCGHMPTMERPAAVSAAMRAWLEHKIYPDDRLKTRTNRAFPACC